MDEPVKNWTLDKNTPAMVYINLGLFFATGIMLGIFIGTNL